MSTTPSISDPSSTEAVALTVEGMNCASCVSHVEKAARQVPGVLACEVNLARGRAVVYLDPKQTTPTTVAEAISHSGYAAQAEGPPGTDSEEKRLRRQEREARSWGRRAWVAIVLWLPLELTHWALRASGHVHAVPARQSLMGWAQLLLATVAIVYVGGKFFASAWTALQRFTSNMDTLISMGAGVAYGYSVVYFGGGLLGAWPAPSSEQLFFMEASGLLALISLGHWLEARARQSAGSAIRSLLEMVPPVAMRIEEGVEPRQVSVQSLRLGDKVLIRPGDQVPVDGVVVEGRSSVDESMISGEPAPVPRQPGDEVIGGTINRDGRLIARATKVGADTVLAQIVSMVESAQASKPPIQRLADRVAAVFVPAVLLVALTASVGWWLWGAAHGWEHARIASQIARAACSVLIIACPCALGLAVPAAVMVGTGRGARQGILFRDISALQQAEKIDTVVLDKTGTVTIGRPEVVQVISSDGLPVPEVLRLAAAAEQYSEHPLARAVVAHARAQELRLPEVESFTSEAGMGVLAQVQGRALLVGNAQWTGASPEPLSTGQTIVYVARRDGDRNVPLGRVRLSDPIKPDSASAVAAMKARGLRVVLLSGDRTAVAREIGRQAGIDEVHGDVRPARKAEVIRTLQAQGSKVAMVGDGINDAPALAAADLGIAIGGGSDIAREAGGVVLVGGSLKSIASAIALSRATMSKIRQNLFLAFIYNVLAIPLAAVGLLNPLIAAAAMALSDVTVIGNALLLRHTRLK